jgi:hypothetical protein
MNRDDLEGLREGWDFEVKLGLARDGLGETYRARVSREFGAPTKLRGKLPRLRGKLRGKFPSLRRKLADPHTANVEHLAA